MAVYVIHFTTKLHHAGHYIGYAEDVDRRLSEHRAGGGSRLLAALNRQGIAYQVARVFPEGDRTFERRLKRNHNCRAICPICRPAYLAEKALKERKRYASLKRKAQP